MAVNEREIDGNNVKDMYMYIDIDVNEDLQKDICINIYVREQKNLCNNRISEIKETSYEYTAV